jgi:hypothetical protein
MKRFLLVLCSTALLTAAPAGNGADTQARGAGVKDHASLVQKLRAAGARVKEAGQVVQPFLAVTGRMIRVDGEDVQVYQYPDPAQADAQAALISADGGSVGTAKIFWAAPPHFFKTGRLLVLYVGQNPRVLEWLQAALGGQIAGR